jgi:DNA-binding transcriptional LysR family regulator
MELRHLRYFVAVAEELHFSRAAERLMIAQPPLSQMIQRLEREIGTRLLSRTKRRVELTEAGRLFLDEARHALEHAERGVLIAQRAARGEVGRLVIGFVGSASYSVLPRVLRGFRQRHPGIELSLHELTTAQQLDALTDRRLDVAFVRTPAERPGIAQQLLIEEDFVAALPAAHALASRRRVRLVELAGERFILFPRALAAGLYDRVVSACQQAGFSPEVVQETTQTPVMIGLVASGLGVALVPQGVRMLKWDNVTYVPLRAPRPTTNIVLASRSDAESAAVQAFVGHAKQAVRSRSDGEK